MHRKKLLTNDIAVVKQQKKQVLAALLKAPDNLFPLLPSAHYPYAM
jgi:hypothetical protein